MLSETTIREIGIFNPKRVSDLVNKINSGANYSEVVQMGPVRSALHATGASTDHPSADPSNVHLFPAASV
jgi:hypothetical protein